MIRSRLRIYCGPEEEASSPVISRTRPESRRVTVPAAEVLTVLADAVRQGAAWLEDFEDDDITISSDLYEVILAYQHFHRPSA